MIPGLRLRVNLRAGLWYTRRAGPAAGGDRVALSRHARRRPMFGLKTLERKVKTLILIVLTGGLGAGGYA